MIKLCCCLQETCFKSKHSLKVKIWKKISHEDSKSWNSYSNIRQNRLYVNIRCKKQRAQYANKKVNMYAPSSKAPKIYRANTDNIEGQDEQFYNPGWRIQYATFNNVLNKQKKRKVSKHPETNENKTQQNLTGCKERRAKRDNYSCKHIY